MIPLSLLRAPSLKSISASDNTAFADLDVKEYGKYISATKVAVHYFAGDLIDTGYTAPAGESYTEKSDIICVIMHKDSVPYMSGFQAQTEFFNALSLTQTHFLIFGHNTLEYLKQYPFIVVRKI